MRKAEWIGSGNKNDKHNTLPPELFRKKFVLKEIPEKAEILISAMGIYCAEINRQRVGSDYFTPGYTHYESYVQVQTYEVTSLLFAGENTLDITAANGWRLGTIGGKNNNYGKERGVIASLRLTFSDGTETVIATDDSWQVTADTPRRFADFYNGETMDNTRLDESGWHFENAVLFHGDTPALKEHIGTFVRAKQELFPEYLGNNTYDFKQNHSGIIALTVKGKKGTVITVRHAEILNADRSLFTKNLRRAKQTLTLICGGGEESFTPLFTCMGFRYAEVTGSDAFEITSIKSLVLTSDCPEIGSFECSDTLLNRLYENAKWGQMSNFVEIPTDCPQRDERMGWTGDIAVFAETATYNRDISLFMKKWLYDLRLYQRGNGTLPVTIPENKTYNPTPLPIPIAIWGDSATMVPWAVYQAYGDLEMLKEQYPSMKAYTASEIRMAARFVKGDEKYLWNYNPFQYGDWCAPNEGVHKWKQKGKHISTAFFANSVKIMERSAHALGYREDEAYYADLHSKIKNAFSSLCTTEEKTLKADFATNYALALYFDLLTEPYIQPCAARLAALVRENNYRIMTGFAGTPYILFALADNGYTEEAYRMLLCEERPSWLFTVKAGGTTIWERWDALAADGSIRADSIPDMISFNHYAYGAVGAFFYRRILGIEPLEAGFHSFKLCPVLSPHLSYAKGSVQDIKVSWERQDNRFMMEVTVPENKTASVILPSGKSTFLESGTYHFEEEL
ncbi:MAG: family 78 glycoside hydrolase catalytic domain [Eubacterium sp.]|nr:family 78 glycoside hydrolase catalytic domain [Eubacterium sp.]